jgi:hypothetical protein
MNAPALRRSLRTGGWVRHAQGLINALLEGGIPLVRTHAGVDLEIRQDRGGGLYACLPGGELVADEHSCHLTRDRVAKPAPRGGPRPVPVRFAPDMLRRLDACAAGSRRTRSHIMRRAVQLYLEGRGF